MAAPPNYLHSFGAPIIDRRLDDGRLFCPACVTFRASTAETYVSDRQRVQVFDKHGQFVRRLKLPEDVTSVHGVALDEKNHEIYVTAPDHHCVLVLSITDDALLRRFGSEGSGCGEFKRPSGICLHQGLVYVCDMGNRRVQVFETSGRCVFAFGQFCLRSAYACVVGPKGEVFVSDPVGDAVTVFDARGRFVHEWGPILEHQRPRNPDGAKCSTATDYPGQFNTPASLAFDAWHRLWVCDTGNHRVQVFHPDGKLIHKFGRRGGLAGELHYPCGLALDHARGRVMVCDGNHRVSVYACSCDVNANPTVPVPAVEEKKSGTVEPM